MAGISMTLCRSSTLSQAAQVTFIAKSTYLLFMLWVFHDIRPVIPREAGQAFHVIPATCSIDSGQAVGA